MRRSTCIEPYLTFPPTHFLFQEQAEPGDPLQGEGKTPVGSRGGRPQQRQREASGAAVPGSTTLAAADATAPTAAAAAAAAAVAAAVDAKPPESSSATNPWRGRRSIDFGVPCTPDPTMMPPSSTSSASGLSSTAGARRGGEGGGRSAAGAGKGECGRSPVMQEPGVQGGRLGEGGATSCFAGSGVVGDAGVKAGLADDRASMRRDQPRGRRRGDDKPPGGQPRLEDEEEEEESEKQPVSLLSSAAPRAPLQPWLLERPQQWLLLQQQQQQQRQLLQQQRQQKQLGEEEVGQGDKAEAAGCVEGFGDDMSTDEAFLDWADVLASSPVPPALNDSALAEVNVQGFDASVVGGSGATVETAAGGLLSEPERPRSVSHSAVSIGSNGSWRPSTERTGLDLGAVSEETPVDGGRPGPVDVAGRWGGNDHHHRVEQDTLADTGSRSVSDSVVCGAAPSAKSPLPAEGAAWDLLFARCAERSAPPGHGTGGLPSSADTRRAPAQGVVTGSGSSPGMCGLSRGDGAGGVGGSTQQPPPPLPLDMEFSDLLFTPEELFHPPPAPTAAAAAAAAAAATGGGGGGGPSSSGSGSGNLSTMQTLGLFNPTLLSDLPWANYGVSGGHCDVFRDPAAGSAPAASAVTGGGGGINGMLHGGSWASATPSAGLAGLGQQSGGDDKTASVAPPHHKAPGGVSGPKQGLSAAASVAPTAMNLSADGNDLAGSQLGGAWPVEGDMLFSRTPLDAEAEIGSTNRGLGDAWGCGADMPGGDLRNSSSSLSQSLRNFSSSPNGFG